MSNPGAQTSRSASFFSTPESVETFRSVSVTWVHTKFVPHASMRGVGVDCVHLCAKIYQECGVFPDYTFPPYSMDGGRHMTKSLVTEWLDRHRCFQSILSRPENAGEFTSPIPIEPGDIVCFHVGRVPHHCGLFFSHQGNMFIHALHRYGVVFGNLSDPTYRDNITEIYRPIGTPASAGSSDPITPPLHHSTTP